MKNTTRSRKALLLVLPAVLLLALVLLFPSADAAQHGHWMERFGWNAYRLSFIRGFALIPLLVGCAVYALVSMISLFGGVPSCLQNKTLNRICAVCAVLLAAAGVYWTVGFSLYLAALPPMPQNMGIYIINHRWVLWLWWAADALLLYCAHPCRDT